MAINIDYSKMETNISPLPVMSRGGGRGGAFGPLRDQMRSLRATQWFVVPGSNLMSPKDKQSVRTAIANCIRSEDLRLGYGQTSDGSLIDYHKDNKALKASGAGGV